MKHISLVCAYLLSLFLYSCENTSELAVASEEYSYLALGDSYTIGESVDSTMRWPVQLADSLS
ncbi:MAG: SGNH/GDSL hydrolase family protein, partial [Bacteroidota bacterium]